MNNITNLQKIVLALFVLIGGYLLINHMVTARLADYEAALRTQQAKQGQVLSELAVSTARNGANATSDSILQDCVVEERERFDVLLSQLDAGLSAAQLVELERLFGRCGSFFADRKQIMVSQMERELALYSDIANQLGQITGRNESELAMISAWQKLVELERKQADSFSDLVKIQDKIISALVAGSSPDSLEILEIMQEAQEVQENLVLANTQAGSVRDSLMSL